MIRPASGSAPLVPLNEASVVIVPLPWASSKTVPSLEAPPSAVVPYRLPLLSMIRPASGFAPLVPLNDASVVIVPLPWASSKTVPSPEAPPAYVVPYRLPLLSMIRPAYGFAPLVPLNEASVVIVPLPWASSKTVPSFGGASTIRCAVQVAAAVHDQAGIRVCTVGAVERGQRGDRAAALGQLENRAVARGASSMRCAVQVAAAVHDQAGTAGSHRWCR